MIYARSTSRAAAAAAAAATAAAGVATRSESESELRSPARQLGPRVHIKVPDAVDLGALSCQIA